MIAVIQCTHKAIQIKFSDTYSTHFFPVRPKAISK